MRRPPDLRSKTRARKATFVAVLVVWLVGAGFAGVASAIPPDSQSKPALLFIF